MQETIALTRWNPRGRPAAPRARVPATSAERTTLPAPALGSNAARPAERSGWPTPSNVPIVYLVDEELAIVAICGHGPNDPAFVTLATRWQLEIEPHARRVIEGDVLTPDAVAGAALSAETFVRVLPLRDAFVGYAVIVERRASRASLRARCAGLGLSRREAEVIELVVAGKRNSEIAATLEIGGATVETHLRNAAVKLGCSSRSSMIVRTLTA